MPSPRHSFGGSDPKAVGVAINWAGSFLLLLRSHSRQHWVIAFHARPNWSSGLVGCDNRFHRFHPMRSWCERRNWIKPFPMADVP